MLRQSGRGFQAAAAPMQSRVTRLIRFCTAFTDNLPLLLKTAFVMGALYFAHDFHSQVGDLVRHPQPQLDVPLATESTLLDVAEETPPPVVNERVRHFLNCTYEAYRREHYETCVESPSDVYKGPPPDDDDTGSILYEQTVLFAYLEDA